MSGGRIEAKRAKLEKAFSPYQSQTINRVNSLETLWQKDILSSDQIGFVTYLSGRGYEVNGSFHALWRATPTVEKKPLMEACEAFIKEAGDVYEEEEWIELGQLATHISDARVKGKKLEEVNMT